MSMNSINTNSSATATPNLTPGANHVDASVGPVVEGNSSLTAHSVFAKDLLQKIMDEGSRPEMRETFDALHSVVEAMKKQPTAKEMTYPNARPIKAAPAFLQGCELPPIQRSLHVIKLAKCEIPWSHLPSYH